MAKIKPECDPGEYGDNVFMMIARVSKALRRAGMEKEEKEFLDRVHESESYEQALDIGEEYVEFI